MTTLASDAFTRADSADLGASWDVVPGTTALQIVSNAVRVTALNSLCLESYNGITWPEDQWAECRITALSAFDGGGPAVRLSPTEWVGYYVTCGSDTNGTNVYRRVGGVETVIAFGPAVAAGSLVRVLAHRDTLSITDDGVEIINVTDDAITGGRGGLCCYNSSGALANNVLDDWAGGDVSGLLVSTSMSSGWTQVAGRRR